MISLECDMIMEGGYLMVWLRESKKSAPTNFGDEHAQTRLARPRGPW